MAVNHDGTSEVSLRTELGISGESKMFQQLPSHTFISFCSIFFYHFKAKNEAYTKGL